jgi:hypothetical protein
MSQRYIFEVRRGLKEYVCHYCAEQITPYTVHMVQIIYYQARDAHFQFRLHRECVEKYMVERYEIRLETMNKGGRPKLTLSDDVKQRRRQLMKNLSRARAYIINGKHQYIPRYGKWAAELLELSPEADHFNSRELMEIIYAAVPGSGDAGSRPELYRLLSDSSLKLEKSSGDPARV